MINVVKFAERHLKPKKVFKIISRKVIEAGDHYATGEHNECIQHLRDAAAMIHTVLEDYGSHPEMTAISDGNPGHQKPHYGMPK